MENTMSEVIKQHSFFSEFKKLANFKSFFFELREKKKKKRLENHPDRVSESLFLADISLY